jgi:hypothetical protein
MLYHLPMEMIISPHEYVRRRLLKDSNNVWPPVVHVNLLQPLNVHT